MSTIPAMPTIKLCDKGMGVSVVGVKKDPDVRAYKTCACQTCSIHNDTPLVRYLKILAKKHNHLSTRGLNTLCRVQ